MSLYQRQGQITRPLRPEPMCHLDSARHVDDELIIFWRAAAT
jgi:hypothetical protein